MIPRSVWSAMKGSQKVVGVMRRMPTVVKMVACHQVNSVHILVNDTSVTVRSCASIVPAFLGSVCSAVAMGGGQPLSSFDELLSMAVQTTSWWMLLMADL